MKREPAERITIAEMKQHSFFSEILWDEIAAKRIPPPFSMQYLANIKNSEKTAETTFFDAKP